MNENDNHITDMQQLADTGWKQMHDMLRQHGLSADVTALAAAPKNRNFFLLFAAGVLFILIFSFPYILNDKIHFTLNSKIPPAAPSGRRKHGLCCPG